MQQFAELFANLDQTNKTKAKLALLQQYFEQAPDADKLWVLALFTHKRPRRQVNMAKIKEWAAELAGIPDWLFQESYHLVGDLAETISLILPQSESVHGKSLAWWINYLATLGPLSEEAQKASVLQAWSLLNNQERFIFIKLLTGGFRIGISQNLVIKAVAAAYQLDHTVVAHRLMGNWQPDSTDFHSLVVEADGLEDLSRPYPFCLAHPLEAPPNSLGSPTAWTAEWKWDGIRGQIIVREGKCYIWSRGEELLTEKFPELGGLAQVLPDGTVLDGELLAFASGSILPFADLQTRIGRKLVTKSILKKAPVAFMAYDLLEWAGQDVRNWPFENRRKTLEKLLESNPYPQLMCSPAIAFSTWEDLAEIRSRSREYAAEGLMLKRIDAVYQVGRKRGDWWKWKVEPLTVDGVLIYAQKGHGRRSGLFTDYTFGVWDEHGNLVPFTKAYSGLTDKEFREVDAFVKKNTQERFGPVRTVKPELVFEIAFEGIRESNRHKSGVALRFPRMLRWRKDKKMGDADTLESLKSLLEIVKPNNL